MTKKEKPVTYKVAISHGIDYAQNERFRKTMEDRHLFEDNVFSYKDASGEHYLALGCIFDGHGGETTAQYLEDNFLKVFQEKIRTYDPHDDLVRIKRMYKILRDTFVAVDQSMSDKEYDGATGAVVVIQEEEDKKKVVYSANCGDARAVLVRDVDGGTGIRLSKDHKPVLPEEIERIQTNGGFVTWGRVNAILAVSRSFGDHVIKNLVISEPYLNDTLITADDKYVIVACDGLWDVVEDAEAAKIVLGCKNAEEAAKTLKETGLTKGTTDNISVMVIKVN